MIIELLFEEKRRPDGRGRPWRDVREHGIPLDTYRVKNAEGRTIGAYRFGDPTKITDTLAGRKTFSKQFKRDLIALYGSRCSICLTRYEERYLQIGHRVPYEVSGDPEDPERNPREYMLICGSCNRAKSWSCEHCENWHNLKATEVCQGCYWAQPESYKHVAMRDVRRLDVVWTDRDTDVYDKLSQRAKASGRPVADYVKDLLRREV